MVHKQDVGSGTDPLSYGSVAFTRKAHGVNGELCSKDRFGRYVTIFVREPRDGAELNLPNFRRRITDSSIGKHPDLPVIILAHKLNVVRFAIQAAGSSALAGHHVLILSNLDDTSLVDWGKEHPGQLVRYEDLDFGNADHNETQR